MTNAILPNLTEIPVERSSQIAAIGYDADILMVQFRRGGLYAYDQVTQAEYDALLKADSVGSIFAKTIKGLKPYKRVDQQQTAVAKSTTKSTAVQNVVPIRSKAMTLDTEPKEVNDLATAAREWGAKATAIAITNISTHALAQKMLLDIDAIRKRIVETWKPMKAAAFAAHRAVCDKESELLKPLESADKLLRSRIGAYTYEQMKIAQAEDEKRRLAAEAEARQRAIEETEQNALAAAEELYAMGDLEGADAVLEAPMPALIRYEMPMPVQPALASVNGVSGSLAYEVTIHDLNAVPREYLVIDVKKTEAEIARRAKQAGGRLVVSGTTIRETIATRRVGGRR